MRKILRQTCFVIILGQKLSPMRLMFYFIVLAAFFSCKKDTANIATPEEIVSYKVILTTAWMSPAFTIPAGAHFTIVAGMVHSKDTFLWSNRPATLGLENVAEVGNVIRMNQELDSMILNHKALSRFAVPAPGINSSIEFPLTFTSSFSCISFASMVAPSPDWFTGINNYCLIQNSKWVDDVTVNLYVHDAGTEDGDIFGYDNPATVPAQNVSLLSAINATVLANGNPVLGKIATVRFIKN
ncbi:MAG: spondin domain-containing protein [Ferruginibacter sp.]